MSHAIEDINFGVNPEAQMIFTPRVHDGLSLCLKPGAALAFGYFHVSSSLPESTRSRYVAALMRAK